LSRLSVSAMLYKKGQERRLWTSGWYVQARLITSTRGISIS
jgi:hypothetical protein